MDNNIGQEYKEYINRGWREGLIDLPIKPLCFEKCFIRVLEKLICTMKANFCIQKDYAYWFVYTQSNLIDKQYNNDQIEESKKKIYKSM